MLHTFKLYATLHDLHVCRNHDSADHAHVGEREQQQVRQEHQQHHQRHQCLRVGLLRFRHHGHGRVRPS